MGKLRIVSQVGIAHIGFNAPAIGCDIDARPSGSIYDWLQRRGRGQRPHPVPQGTRSYQDKWIADTRAALIAKQTPMMVGPCGAGKSYIACKMAALAQQKGKAIGFVTIRRVLVDDLSSTLSSFGVPHSILMEGRTPSAHRTVVASIHTMASRDSTLDVDAVYFDEAHLLLSPAFRAVVERHRHLPRILMTATPGRSDQQPLRLLADTIVMGPTTQQLIDMGYLVPTRLFAAELPDVTGVDINNEEDCAKLMNRPGLNAKAVKQWKLHGEDRPTIVHACNVAHSKSVVEKFLAAGIEARHLDASHSDAERDDTFAELQLNAPAKKDVILLDLAGNAYSRFGLPEDDREWSLDSSEPPSAKPREQALSLRRCPECLAVFRAYTDQCPECGKGYAPTQRRIIERDLELKEIAKKEKAERQAGMTDDVKLAILKRIVEAGRAKGNKPFAAVFKYKSATGEDLPREWYRHVYSK